MLASPPHAEGRERIMAERLQVYECEVCGNIVEVARGGKGELVCCDEPMKLLVENTVDAAVEKHVPVIEKVDGGIKVKVGSETHPMIEEHHIEWIEVIDGDVTHIAFLKPGDEPEAVFPIDKTDVVAREHCNLHGLWKM
jgi:superoxide reductase